jgi:small GTP-binding protein
MAAGIPARKTMPKLPLIVILGRPNVGKSTLFNRIVGSRRALVGNEPGMTRDRIEGTAEWQGTRFRLVDTGGIVPQDRETIPAEIFRHARMAIDEAAHLVLVVDGREGVLPLDQELCNLLRRMGKPISLAINKIDLPMHTPLAAEFASLGLENSFPVSAEHGLGVDQLLSHDDDRPAAPGGNCCRLGSARQDCHHRAAQRGQVDAAESPGRGGAVDCNSHRRNHPRRGGRGSGTRWRKVLVY